MGFVDFSHKDDGLVVLQPFDQFNDVVQCTTTRQFGEANSEFAGISLNVQGVEKGISQRNLALLCKKLDVESDRFILPNQTHGNCVKIIADDYFSLTSNAKNTFCNNCDGLVTNLKNVCIGVLTADCLPVVFYDPGKKVVAIAHAGWRGAASKIVTNVVEIMIKNYGSNPENMIVAIGPSITGKNYEVSPDFSDNFQGVLPTEIRAKAISKKGNKQYFDLHFVTQYLLVESGVKKENVYESGSCTYSSNHFFSFRKMPSQKGSMITCIGLKDKC